MKVSKRIKELQKLVKEASMCYGDGVEIDGCIIQLEVEIVEVLQVARQDSYTEGYSDGTAEGFSDGFAHCTNGGVI